MSDRVSISIEDGIADVRLNRPDKLNALDADMFEALAATGKSLRNERTLRAVVLSGEGRGFCAGLDVMSFMGKGGSGTRSLFERSGAGPANLAQQAAWVWTEVPVPVIAAIHGVAFGGGLQIALGADLRFVTPDARFSVMEIKWGLVPDMSLTQTLRRLVRLDVAKELTFSGRVFSGSEAVELGLATHLSDSPREAAFELAREIATKSPHAIRAAKQLLDRSGVGSIEDGLLLEEELQRSVLGKPNQIEAVRANLEKRDPNFEDPE
jgi:enoyl-CoA hydratase/carnithine racemase